MEYSMGGISGEWSYLIGGMFATEEADFMAQLLNNCPNIPDHGDGISNFGFQSTIWPSDVNIATQESPMFMDFCMEDASNTSSYLVEPDDDHCLNQDMLGNELGNVEPKLNQQPAHLPTKVETAKIMPHPQPIIETKSNNGSENSSKKRCRSSGDDNQKNKRNARSKKQQQQNSNNNSKEDGINGGSVNGQSSESCSWEDDSNSSQELNGGLSSSSTTAAALNLNDKTRANRGAATDPQSLYARKRRERINERLKILQNLVPNGTKVDISTMLEEAVQYVKFLQLQIKLLSSDDLWMYAPIAYNGMDIGLDIKVGTLKRS